MPPNRYCICIEEMQQNIQIIMQCLNQLPRGMIKADDHKLCCHRPSNFYYNFEALAWATYVDQSSLVELILG